MISELWDIVCATAVPLQCIKLGSLFSSGSRHCDMVDLMVGCRGVEGGGSGE